MMMMAMNSNNSTPRAPQGDVTAEWRIAEGAYLRDLREARGLTQQDLADAMGANNKQMISQIETGRLHIPQAALEQLAKALKVDLEGFARNILRWQAPFFYAALFGADPALKRELTRARPRYQGAKRS